MKKKLPKLQVTENHNIIRKAGPRLHATSSYHVSEVTQSVSVVFVYNITLLRYESEVKYMQVNGVQQFACL